MIPEHAKDRSKDLLIRIVVRQGEERLVPKVVNNIYNDSIF